MTRFLVLISLLVAPLAAQADIEHPFFLFGSYVEPLAPRDSDGLLHQSKNLRPTDFAPRASTRVSYYFQSGTALTYDVAYVASLQDALRRLGYYCGPTDGVFSDAVHVAIARLQKNYSFRVTGTLTLPVRRALFLP